MTRKPMTEGLVPPFPAKRPELLAPAGDRNKLETAIAYGADAVYLGSKSFSLRAQSSNFTLEELADAVRYAHDRQVKTYVAANILAHPQDQSVLREFLRALRPIGPDGLIISDPGVFVLAREEAPESRSTSAPRLV